VVALEQVERDWVSLWQRLSAAGEPLPVFKDLIARYTEPHRGYHSLVHVLDCLQEFQSVRNLAIEPDAIEIALWFHDAIYDPRAADNEAQSARLAENVLRQAKLPDQFVQRVSDLILATRHQAAPESADAQLLVDIDLAVLGQSTERFDAYEAGVRKEYDWVPRLLFAGKRAAILKSFLDRPAIYSTPWFQNKYEHTARANLERSIRRLSSPQ
jgi:predicted metal-dependent HD superfamily phosphohydrolase